MRADRLEAEEGVGIDDDGKLEALEQPRHERVRLGAAAEPRPERDGVGALCLGHDRLLGVVPVEAALDGLERQHLDRCEALARHGERDVARVGAKRGHRGEHRRARRPGRAADDEHRAGGELGVAGAADRDLLQEHRGRAPHRGLDRQEPDVGDDDLAGVEAPGRDVEPDLARVERDGERRVDGGAGDLARRRVDAGGQVDGDDRQRRRR